MLLSYMSHSQDITPFFQTAIMVRLVLMFTAAIIDFVYGIPPYLPPLPTKGEHFYMTVCNIRKAPL